MKFPLPLWAPNDAVSGVAASSSPDATPPAANPPDADAGAAPGGAPSLISQGSAEPAATPSAGLEPLESFEGLLPEGFAIPEDRTAEVLELVNGAQTRSDLVKGLFDLYAKEVTAMQGEAADAWNRTQTDWQTELKSDSVYGGANLQTSLAAAKEMALKLGGEDLLKVLDATGTGNSVHFLRAMMKARELIPQEGTPTSGTPSVPPKSLADRMYPSTAKQ